MKNWAKMLVAGLAVVGCCGDDCNRPPTSDENQQAQQERILQEGTSQVGMPAIKNFREKKMMKMVLEMRDQEDLSTFTYVWSDYQGKWVFFCNSIGYGIPYATQFTSPEKIVYPCQSDCSALGLPQADPNGLFSPASAEGTWVMCKNPHGDDVKPVYLEPRIITTPWELPKNDIEKK